MDKRVTLRDVAKAVNLSPTAVSMALSGRHSQISAERRARIRVAADSLGYRAPDSVQRPARRSLNVWVILPDIYNSFFSNIAGGVDAYLTPEGHRMELKFGDNSPEREKEHLQKIAHSPRGRPGHRHHHALHPRLLRGGV